MLVDRQIKAAISAGDIVVAPYRDDCIKGATAYFKLGKVLLIPQEQSAVVDIKNQIQPKFIKIDISKDGYILEPRSFILGQTLESLSLSSKVGMVLDGRSSLARLGLGIHQTSFFCQPGHEGVITLELFNASNFRIKLDYGIGIAKGVFFMASENAETSYKHYGKYAGQKETMAPNMNHQIFDQ